MLVEFSNVIIALMVLVLCMYTLIVFGCIIILTSAVNMMMSNNIISRLWNKIIK